MKCYLTIWIASSLTLGVVLGLPLLGGSASVIIEPREPLPIIGGKPSQTNAYPWMAALEYVGSSDNYNGHFCGGALIHPRYVITAAHCIEDVEPSEIFVLLGVNNLDDPDFDAFAVVDIIIHPEWDNYYFEPDVALLVLDRPATEYQTLPIIPPDSSLDAVGAVARAIGWGATDTEVSEFPSELREVDLPILSNVQVNTATSYDGEITEQMLAAGFLSGGKDSCQGDSGGPLVVRDLAGNFILAGITSFGEGCAEPNFPGIYTRVSQIRNWVYTNMFPNYLIWETEKNVSGMHANADSDAYSNLIEYALGSDPSDANSIPTTLFGTHRQDELDYFKIEFQKPQLNAELSVAVEVSQDLGNWSLLDSSLLSIPPIGTAADDYAPFAVRTALSIAEAGQQFLRVSVDTTSNYVPIIGSLPPDIVIRNALHPGDLTNSAFQFFKDFQLTDFAPGQTYTLATYSENIDTLLELYDANTQTLLAENDDGGEGDNALINFTPAAGKSYFARVLAFSPEVTGRFSLAASKRLITPGQTINGSLQDTDEIDPLPLEDTYYKDDYLLLPPANGTSLTLRLSSNDFDTYLEIVDARNGELIDFNDDISESNFDSEYELLVTGALPLYLRVTSAAPETEGSYTLVID